MTGSRASWYSSVPDLPKNRIIPLSANSLAWASPSRSSVARTYWERTSWMACLSVIDGSQLPSEGETALLIMNLLFARPLVLSAPHCVRGDLVVFYAVH